MLSMLASALIGSLVAAIIAAGAVNILAFVLHVGTRPEHAKAHV